MTRPGRVLARRLVPAGLALALAAHPAAAQPDPLGLGEFGAYLNPDQARRMIAMCDAQTGELQARLTAFVEAMNELKAREAGDARDAEAWFKEWREANRALAEAEAHLANLRGAEADRFAAQVVEPRRQRAQSIRNRNVSSPIFLEEALDVAAQRARSARDLLHELGVSDERMARSTIDQLVHDQSERCRRMRIWARLGENR